VHVRGIGAGQVAGAGEVEGDLAAAQVNLARHHVGFVAQLAVVRQHQLVAVQVVGGDHVAVAAALQQDVAAGGQLVGDLDLAHGGVGLPGAHQPLQLREGRGRVALRRRARARR
jgi:hypothetical protein